MSTITQAMLDAERERARTAIPRYARTSSDGAEYSFEDGCVYGWDTCLAFLREHGELVSERERCGVEECIVIHAPDFVRVEIPAK